MNSKNGTKSQKREILRKLIEALKDVASKIDIIEKALKEDNPSFGALDDLQ